jgi:glutamine amidotransferase
MMRESLGVEAYESIAGSSDSEHLFAMVIDKGLAGALERLEKICTDLNRTASATVIMGDGEQLAGVRWAFGMKPATLYAASFGEGVCLASEPLDDRRWRELPPGEIVTLRAGDLR